MTQHIHVHLHKRRTADGWEEGGAKAEAAYGSEKDDGERKPAAPAK